MQKIYLKTRVQEKVSTILTFILNIFLIFFFIKLITHLKLFKTTLLQSFKEKIINPPAYKKYQYVTSFENPSNRFENLVAFGMIVILLPVYAFSWTSNQK